MSHCLLLPFLNHSHHYSCNYILPGSLQTYIRALRQNIIKMKALFMHNASSSWYVMTAPWEIMNPINATFLNAPAASDFPLCEKPHYHYINLTSGHLPSRRDFRRFFWWFFFVYTSREFCVCRDGFGPVGKIATNHEFQIKFLTNSYTYLLLYVYVIMRFICVYHALNCFNEQLTVRSRDGR